MKRVRLVAALCRIGASCLAQSSEDKAALLAVKARSDPGLFASWDPSTDPCGEGWDSADAGWEGVMCCADITYGDCSSPHQNLGRPTYLDPSYLRRVDTGGRRVSMSYAGMSSAVRFALSDLAPLDSLQSLRVSGYAAVTGDIAVLTTMVLLTKLTLGGASVHGDAAVIRAAIPGLSDWGLGARHDDGDFTRCTYFPCGSDACVTDSDGGGGGGVRHRVQRWRCHTPQRGDHGRRRT